MKNTARQSRGTSVLGVFIFILMLLVLAYIVARLAPAYVDNYQIKISLEAMAQDPSVKDLTREEIRDFFMRRIQVNNVRNFDSSKLDIERKNNKLVFVVNYDTRVHVIANIDAVMTFNNQVSSE